MKVHSNLCPCGGYHAPWRCPKISSMSSVQLKESFFGPSTSVFVGRIGYPNVFAGPLGALKDADTVDSPGKWFGMNYADIIALRFSMIRSKEMHSVHARDRLISDMQEIALAKRPTDVEMLFRKRPSYKMTFSLINQPMGPSAELQKLILAENPKINAKVERIARGDIKASDAVSMIYLEGPDVYQISNILSSGILGVQNKLVPTRWSITAVDDILAKNMMKEIRQFRPVNEFLVFSSYFLDNKFDILLMPGNWEYENFESSPDDGMMVEEYEPFHGRKTYAEKEGGGYYAARFAVCEALHKMRKQARVIVFREIGKGYSVPLGVWVIRQTVRDAFKKPPVKFSDLKSVFSYISSRLQIPLSKYMERSLILRQKRLNDF